MTITAPIEQSPSIAVAPAVHVGLITWGPDHGDVDEYIIVSANVATVNKALVAELLSMYVAAPDVFGDDSPLFLNGIRTSEGIVLEPAHKDLDIESASDADLEQWLVDFREATTAPWWTVTEHEIV